MEAATATSNGAVPAPVRPQSAYRIVVTGRLLQHAQEVFTSGCHSPRDCPDCRALRKAAVLGERHALPDAELDV